MLRKRRSIATAIRMLGTHHRVMLQDVLAYKKEMFAKRHAALDELTTLDQELGLYDDPMK